MDNECFEEVEQREGGKYARTIVSFYVLTIGHRHVQGALFQLPWITLVVLRVTDLVDNFRVT